MVLNYILVGCPWSYVLQPRPRDFAAENGVRESPENEIVCSQIYRDIIQNFCPNVNSYCLCLDHRRSCEDESSRGIYKLNLDSNKFKVSLKVITLWAELKLHFVTRCGTVLCRLIAYGPHFKLGLLEKAFVGNFCLLFIYLFIYLSIYIIYSSVSIHFVYYFLFGNSLFMTTRLAIIHK